MKQFSAKKCQIALLSVDNIATNISYLQNLFNLEGKQAISGIHMLHQLTNHSTDQLGAFVKVQSLLG